MIVITLWVLPALFSTLWFWNPFITLWYGIIGIPLCLIISILSYTKIFLTLRQHNTQIHNQVQQPTQTNQLNIAKYKKAVATAIWLQLTLVACYLPYGVASAFVTNNGKSSPVLHAWIYAGTLVLLNSSINPILYCWKLEEVSVMEIMVFRNKFSRCRYIHQLLKVFIHSTYILRNLYSFVA